MICKLCRVTGHVQGVFYRASTQQQANELNVTGYALNRTDKSVEVLACGKEVDVTALCNWLHEGPAYARVENVDCVEHELVNLAHFETR